MSLRYSEMMTWLDVPLNLRAHYACVILEHLGYDFCADYGYMNAEEIVESKGLLEDLNLLAPIAHTYGKLLEERADGESELPGDPDHTR